MLASVVVSQSVLGLTLPPSDAKLFIAASASGSLVKKSCKMTDRPYATTWLQREISRFPHSGSLNFLLRFVLSSGHVCALAGCTEFIPRRSFSPPT